MHFAVAPVGSVLPVGFAAGAAGLLAAGVVLGADGAAAAGAAEPVAAADSEDLLALDEALTRFAEVDPTAARLVQLRYFTGLSMPAAAEVLGISPRTAARLWAYARAWLLQEIAPA